MARDSHTPSADVRRTSTDVRAESADVRPAPHETRPFAPTAGPDVTMMPVLRPPVMPVERPAMGVPPRAFAPPRNVTATYSPTGYQGTPMTKAVPTLAMGPTATPQQAAERDRVFDIMTKRAESPTAGRDAYAMESRGTPKRPMRPAMAKA